MAKFEILVRWELRKMSILYVGLLSVVVTPVSFLPIRISVTVMSLIMLMSTFLAIVTGRLISGSCIQIMVDTPECITLVQRLKVSLVWNTSLSFVIILKIITQIENKISELRDLKVKVYSFLRVLIFQVLKNCHLRELSIKCLSNPYCI